ncbi:MAG TPA: ankyrin repeat domain-containing protein, partial [Candidatus Babeliales bacterium]|nr:ankyrin repeat domain-containing protein [Candidatus Babeliales bacterium]
MKRIFSLIVVCLLAVPSSMMAAQDEPISAWDSRFTLLRSPTRQAQQLIAAAEEGHVNTVKELLAVPGIDANAQGDCGYTALIYAAGRGYENVVKELLAAPD